MTMKNEQKQYPAVNIATKYGALSLMFLDVTPGPDDARKQQSDKHVAYLSGEVTIRGVPIRVSTRLYFATREYEGGVPLPKPIIVMDMDYRTSYNRRSDTNDALTPGARKTLGELVNGIVRSTYEANRLLVFEATRVRVWNDMCFAEDVRDRAYEAYMEAEENFALASAKVV
jgi:hypothetical protein